MRNRYWLYEQYERHPTIMSVSHSEAPCEDFTIEYHDDGLIVYRVTAVKRQVVDCWVETFKRHEEKALADQRHLRRLMDVRGAGFPTPYAMSKAVEIVSHDPEDLRESYAILVGDSATNQIFSAALGHLDKWLSNTRLFTDEQNALEWLQQRLAELGV
jgi:hypothetical protein